MRFITALVPEDGCDVTSTSEQIRTFGTPYASVQEEYGISTTEDSCLSGCTATTWAYDTVLGKLRENSEAEAGRYHCTTPCEIGYLKAFDDISISFHKIFDQMRLSCNIHCNGFPHIETIAHCLTGTQYEPLVLQEGSKKHRKIGVFDCLPHGTFETAVLVRPSIVRFADSTDTYPAGAAEDLVITKRALLDAFRRVDLPAGIEASSLSLVISVHDETRPIKGDWNNWPYLTTEAVRAIMDGLLQDANGRQVKIDHFRTNLPSIERMDSNGGMWNHSLMFGIDSERRISWLENNSLVESDGKRLKKAHRFTVGEAFCIPDNVPEGVYKLLCAVTPLQLDASFATPLLFEYNIL